MRDDEMVHFTTDARASKAEEFHLYSFYRKQPGLPGTLSTQNAAQQLVARAPLHFYGLHAQRFPAFRSRQRSV